MLECEAKRQIKRIMDDTYIDRTRTQDLKLFNYESSGDKLTIARFENSAWELGYLICMNHDGTYHVKEY